MLLLISILLLAYVIIPAVIKYFDYLEKKRFQQLYGNMTVKEIIDLFYSDEINEEDKK